MGVSPGLIAFKIAFQLTPVILTRGIATAYNNALPIIALTEASAFFGNALSGILSGSQNVQLDDFFAHYQPLPGASLVQNQVAMYPFANQAIAANAIIAQPLNISLLMICPAKNEFGYALKLATMIGLQSSLAQHNSQGGTYTIITPSCIYTDCIMTGMRDVSGGESRQPQYAWQLDFLQPLVSLAAAQTAYNGLMQQLANGTPIVGSPSWSIYGLAVGNPTQLLLSSIVHPPA